MSEERTSIPFSDQLQLVFRVPELLRNTHSLSVVFLGFSIFAVYVPVAFSAGREDVFIRSPFLPSA